MSKNDCVIVNHPTHELPLWLDSLDWAKQSLSIVSQAPSGRSPYLSLNYLRASLCAPRRVVGWLVWMAGGET